MTQQLRFSRIKLQNWRNFTNVDVPIADRAFIVGPNAAGKSNFLDAFLFLHDVARARGGLQDAVGDRGGLGPIRNSEARGNPIVGIEVEISVGDDPAWTYRLSLMSKKGVDPALVKAEEVLRWDGNEWERVTHQAQGASQTLLEQHLANKDFSDLHSFLADIRYRHLVPQLVREPGAHLPGEVDPFGRSLLQRMAETPRQTRDARLRRIGAALATAVPGLRTIEWDDDNRSNIPHLIARFKHWRPGDARRDERSLSDGTLRLVGILWELLDAQSVVLLEEPELSLHEQLVGRLPSLFAGVAKYRTAKRGLQTIITTHSARMFDDEGIGLDEVILVEPSAEKARSDVRVAGSIDEIRRLVVDAGISLGDVLQSHTSPVAPNQLILDLGA